MWFNHQGRISSTRVTFRDTVWRRSVGSLILYSSFGKIAPFCRTFLSKESYNIRDPTHLSHSVCIPLTKFKIDMKDKKAIFCPNTVYLLRRQHWNLRTLNPKHHFFLLFCGFYHIEKLIDLLHWKTSGSAFSLTFSSLLFLERVLRVLQTNTNCPSHGFALVFSRTWIFLS